MRIVGRQADGDSDDTTERYDGNEMTTARRERAMRSHLATSQLELRLVHEYVITGSELD
jgi:hypothetical protein